MTYILVTPVKNEEKSLHNLIESVASQSIKPVLWVIVDDGSTDKCPEIIENAINEYEWIKSIRLKESERDITIHVSNVIKTGLDFAREYCEEHDYKYGYVAFLDADMIIPDKDFFKKLSIEFEKDDQLGIASGKIQIMDGLGNLHNEKRRTDTISGGEMICRRECFENVGGVPLSYAWESVLRVKAILNGWKIKRLNDIKIIQTRETSSAEGLKKGYYVKGTSEHYLNSNPFIVVAKGFKYCFKSPHYTGLAYLCGYFSSWIGRKEQIDDEEVKKYFYWHKPREIWQYYINKSR